MEKLHDNEEQLRKMYIDEKLTLSKIAKKCGVSRETISNRLKKYNIPRRETRWTEEQIEYLIEHPDDSIDDISKNINRTKSAITGKRMDLKNEGLLNHKSIPRYTTFQKEIIIYARINGGRHKEIARALNITSGGSWSFIDTKYPELKNIPFKRDSMKDENKINNNKFERYVRKDSIHLLGWFKTIESPQCPRCGKWQINCYTFLCRWKCVKCEKSWKMTQEEIYRNYAGKIYICTWCKKEFRGYRAGKDYFCPNTDCYNKWNSQRQTIEINKRLKNMTEKEIFEIVRRMGVRPNTKESRLIELYTPYGFEYNLVMINRKLPDLTNEEHKLIVEYDGEGNHSIKGWAGTVQGLTQQEIDQRDHNRNQGYVQAGYRVLILRKEHLEKQPDQILVHILEQFIDSDIPVYYPVVYPNQVQ